MAIPVRFRLSGDDGDIEVFIKDDMLSIVSSDTDAEVCITVQSISDLIHAIQQLVTVYDQQ